MCTTQFVKIYGTAEYAQYVAEGTFGVVSVHAGEEALMCKRVLILGLCVAKEEGRMMDHVVGEYADLVHTFKRHQNLLLSPPPSRPHLPD